MQRPSRGLAGLALALSAVAVVALVSTGFDQQVDESFCFQIALLLEIILFMSFVLCIVFCNNERPCEVRCITVFLILQLLILIFLITCLIRAGGGIF